MNFEHFHFIRPYFLLILFVVFWLMWRLYKRSRNNNAWSNVCDPELLSYLLVGRDKKSSLMPVWLLFIVGILLSIALAGPTWQKLPQAVYKKEAARVFVMDLSRSMDATDVSPTRASRAKLKLIDLLKASNEGQMALVVYAADSHVVSPLTDDADTIVAMIPSLSPAIMPAQGSRTDLAIMKAAQLLTQAGNHDGEIILITDGANGDRAIRAVEKISEGGYTLHVMGVGTEQGSPIPNQQGGFLKDNSGGIVIPKLDRSELKKIALAGGGVYVDLTVDEADVSVLIRDQLNTSTATDNPLTREVDFWQDEGHWFLLIALPFAMLGFRRGWLTVVVVSVCYMPQGELYAFEWQDMWQTPDQQASKLLDAGEAEKAAGLYKNKNWKGAAYYKSGDFEQAAEAYASVESESNSVDATYNRANALARQGKFEEALEAYDDVLTRDPEHEDAKFNKDVVQKAKENQKQKPAGDDKQKGDEDSDSKEKQESEEQQESDNSDSQEDSEEKQDQQSESGEEGEQDDKDKESEQQQSDEQNEEKTEEEKEAEQQKAQEQEEMSEEEKAQEKLKEQQDMTDEEKAEQERQQKEIEQATQQWLRRIPDDPGGLLREKFSRQYQRQRQRQQTENPW